MRPLHTLALGMMLLLGMAASAQDKDKPAKEPDKDTFESALKDQLKLLNDLCDILELAKDEASGEKAIDKMKPLGPRQKDLEARMKKLGKPSKEDEEVLKKKFEGDLKKTTGRLTTELIRLSKDDKLKKVAEAMTTLMSGPKPKPDDKPKPEDKPKDK